MPNHKFHVFSTSNLSDLPVEDASYMSNLDPGDQVTWIGGAGSVPVTISDAATTFCEAKTDQTLVHDVTLDGVTYPAGQLTTPSYAITFTGSDGATYEMVSFHFSGNVNFTAPDGLIWLGNVPPDGTVLTVQSESNPTGSTAPQYAAMAVCLAAEVLLRVPGGTRSAGSLKSGDLVMTERGPCPVLWTLLRRVTAETQRHIPALCPMIIPRDALGPGCPSCPLRLSRQHRVALASAIVKRMYGVPQILVPAAKLSGWNGIGPETKPRDVTYVHLLLPHHALLDTSGLTVESLLPGPQLRATLPAESLGQMDRALNGTETATGTRHRLASGRRIATLLRRHRLNDTPLFARPRPRPAHAS